MITDDDGEVSEDEAAASKYTFKNKLCLWFAYMGMPIPKLAKDDGIADDETIFDKY